MKRNYELENGWGSYRQVSLCADTLPSGSFSGGIGIDFKKYKMVAFPGPSVVEEGRIEHLPLHLHVRFDGKELRIDCENLTEMNGRKIPKDLKQYLKTNRGEISDRVNNIFMTGSID